MRDEQPAKTVAYNPCAAGGAQWSDRFSHIKTAFEAPKQVKPASERAPDFTHAPQSPFKPVAPAFGAKPRSRDSGYDSHTNSAYQPDHNSLPRHFFNSLERKSAHGAPKTYYAPTASCAVTHHGRGYRANGYKTDSHLSPYYATAAYYDSYRRAKPAYAAPKTEYFLNEPSAYIADYLVSSQPVSPTIPTTCSSSPTYPDEPFASLPTSPLAPPKRAPTAHWKPVEYYEERPAIAKIMGRPQQAVVVNAKTSYRGTAPAQFATETGAASTYQKLAQKSPLLQHFAQPRGPPKEARKQVTIVGVRDDERNLPEQFFVQNQRCKFEGLGATAPRMLPPQINEKAFFKPVAASAPRRRQSPPPPVVQQCRSPPQSPVVMPSVLQKSESWHQMIMERMKQAKPPSPMRPKIARAKSTHNLACAPKQFEATMTPEAVERKQHTVERFLGKGKLRRTETVPAAQPARRAPSRTESAGKSVTVTKLNEDFKHVDEAFELLFSEASGKSV